ncbi:MAG: AAA family ATPase, partial [Flavobacteriales bacterium]|nr:AAA family ATPase [Flavobacteriales bacterium]
MLKQLQIKNYALIDELDIEFSNNLSVITGETGAGKSILLGALGLILGKRADVQTLQNKENKCIIEGFFQIGEYQLNSFFDANDLDYEIETTLRREISPSGKSRAFINDTPVNLGQLKEIGSYLIDVHSQHEALLLNSTSFKFSVIDSFAGHSDKLKQYKEHYSNLAESKKILAELVEEQKQSKLDIDYFQFQLDELLEANIKPDEQEQIELELKTLSNAEMIKETLYQSFLSLSDEDDSLLDKFRLISTELNRVREYSKEIEAIAKRIDSAFIEVGDLASEIDSIQGAVSYDAEKIQIVNERLNSIYALQQKHQVNTNAQLLDVQLQLEIKLQGISSLQEAILKAENAVDELTKKVNLVGEKISTKRKQVIPKLQKAIIDLLHLVKMPHSNLSIELDSSEVPNQYGLDNIQLLFSANKGGDLHELSKVASGGELSRLMLCIKSITSEHIALPSIVFDEIDT